MSVLQYELAQIVAEVTQRCNFRCIHCGSACDHEQGKNELTIDEWNELCFLPAAKLGVRNIVLSGGEPTLKSGFPTMCKYAKLAGLDYAFITNGFNLSDELLAVLSEFRPYAVGFSIDGLKATHNTIRQNDQSWNRLMSSISKVQEIGIDVCAITTVNKMNLDEMTALGDFLAKAEITSWQIQLAMPAGRMSKHRDIVLDEASFQRLCQAVYSTRETHPEVYTQAADCFGVATKGIIRSDDWGGCGAGIASIGMDACGNVMPCLSVREDMTAGNLRERSLSEIWNAEESFPYSRKFKVSDADGGSCEGCKIIGECRGGCLSQSLSFNGRLHAAPFCFYRSFEKGMN